MNNGKSDGCSRLIVVLRIVLLGMKTRGDLNNEFR